MTDKMRVRQRLLEYLSENNLTIYQFAKKSGIPESTVRGIVQKEDYDVRESNIHKICEGMGIPSYEIFQGKDDEVAFLREDEIPIVEKYRCLCPNYKYRVQGYVDALLEDD